MITKSSGLIFSLITYLLIIVAGEPGILEDSQTIKVRGIVEKARQSGYILLGTFEGRMFFRLDKNAAPDGLDFGEARSSCYGAGLTLVTYRSFQDNSFIAGRSMNESIFDIFWTGYALKGGLQGGRSYEAMIGKDVNNSEVIFPQQSYIYTVPYPHYCIMWWAFDGYSGFHELVSCYTQRYLSLCYVDL